ncbi:MAG TPA: alpha/beta hydrolase [Stellaceae bacterium]|nr:alpha/beta hydrolase [Stellaceae bacterium]
MPQPLAVVEAVSADGAVLRLRRHGNPQGATRLFVSHGNGFAIDGYFDFWGRFLGDFDVVTFDMRNHGQNPPADPAHHDYAHMVQDIDAVCRAACAEFGGKPTAGLFHSMSAQAALLQAMGGGGHFEALILFDPPNVPPPNVPPQGDAARAPMLAYLRMLTLWAGQRRERFAEPAELAAEYAATRAGQGWASEAHDLMARSVLRRDGEDWALACPGALESAMYRQGITLDLWPQQSDVPVPVTLIGADPERAYPAATGLANRALAASGGFDHTAIPGTSHLMQLEEPAACADAALAALARFGL